MLTPRNTSPWITTYTGKKFHLLNPSVEEVDILDISHALSMLSRFNGHCKKFYSVGEHSVLVSKIIDQKYALHGLLHDGAESFCGDITSPLKPHLSNYQAIENRISEVIYEKFNCKITKESEEAVKLADNIALITEAESLFGEGKSSLFIRQQGIEPLNVKIDPLPPRVVEHLFLDRFYEIKKN